MEYEYLATQDRDTRARLKRERWPVSHAEHINLSKGLPPSFEKESESKSLLFLGDDVMSRLDLYSPPKKKGRGDHELGTENC